MSSSHLEHRLLHKVLVAVNSPTNWPAWLTTCAVLLPIASVTGLWWLLVGGQDALYLVISVTVFVLADALILVSLRHWRFSFGPVRSQLFTLEMPRLAVVLLAIPVAVWLGSTPVLIGVVIVNFGATLALVWGAFIEPQRLGLSHVSFVGASQCQDISPVRLLHISDLHVER